MRAGRGVGRGSSGLSLPELLVALALGVTLLGLVGAALASARRHASAAETHADTVAALLLTAELLQEELRVAGMLPWPATEGERALASAWLTPGLTVALAAHGHTIGLRGNDHRLSGPDVARDLSFEAGVDGRGEAQLYRRAAGSVRQPLVAGVESLRVGWVVTSSGTPVDLADAHDQALSALVLETEVRGQRYGFVVELPGRPILRVVGP